MPFPAGADYIQVPGLVHIYIAVPNAYNVIFKLGEPENGIQVRKNPLYSRVSGDRYGGNEGPPIEMQFLGLNVEFELAMSRWDPVQLAKLENFGGLLTTPGTVPLTAVGALMLRDRAYRFLLYSVRDPSHSINFPCCTWDKPQVTGKQTKYSVASLGVLAHRAPEGYWNDAAVGKVYDNDIAPGP